MDSRSENRAPAPGPSAKGALLICDDEDGPRESLRIVFKRSYDVLPAKSGEEALAIAQQRPIDVAILDIRMPGMSGTEVLKRLKQIDPSTEVIMLTAFETLDTAKQAVNYGACNYFTKPFDIADFSAAVEQAMKRRAAHKSTQAELKTKQELEVETLRLQQEKNRLEAEMLAHREQLLQLQADLRNQKLQEEISRTRGEIYASILHDINSPLTVISGFVEIMNQRVGTTSKIEGEDLAMFKDRMGRISRQVGNCVEISRRYLSYLRDRSAATASVEVSQVLKDLSELLKFHPSVGSNELVVHRLESDATVSINGTDLLQILLNLAINALQSTPDPHRVEVHGRIAGNPLDLGAFVDGSDQRLLNREAFPNRPPILSLTVEDNGPGIPPQVLPRIFESYFTTKAQGKGSGLGLSIVQRLVKANNSALHVRTKLGHGTAFTLFTSVKD